MTNADGGRVQETKWRDTVSTRGLPTTFESSIINYVPTDKAERKLISAMRSTL